MAAVHFGRLVGEAGFQKTVAIKRLHRRVARQESFKKSILEEGRLAARIHHPNVVPPLDVVAEQGEVLLVMEYVHGESLSRLCRAAWTQGEKIPLAVAAAILANVLHGLHAAHEAKDEKGKPLDIVHRDVSPQNVLVGVDGVARVIDFGIAKAITSGENTTAGTIKGKLPYLSPEQLEGNPATRRTDIYAAGVCFWEVLAGKRLFDAKEDPEILRQILSLPVKPPSDYNPSVPGAVDDVILRALARNPAERFATARDMALALEEAVHLATCTMVGAWAERLAASSLAERAHALAAVEGNDKSASDRPPPAIEPEMVEDAVPPPPARTIAIPARHTPAPPPPIAPIEGVRPLSPALLDETAHAPLVMRAEVAPYPPPPPPVAAAKPTGGAKRAVVRVAILLVVLAVVGGYLGLPLYLKKEIIEGAAKRGVILTIDRVDVSTKNVRLVGVAASSADLEGMKLQANAIDLGLRDFALERISIPDAELRIDATYADALSRIAAFRKKNDAALSEYARTTQHVTVASARIEWNAIGGPNTSALLENVRLDVDRTSSNELGDDYKLEAPLVKVKTGELSYGSWHLLVARSGIITKATLKLDPTGSYAATITYSMSVDGSSGVSFAVPPTSLADLRVPPALFGARANDKSKLDLRGEVTLGAPKGGPLGPRTFGGRAFAGAYGLAVFPGSPLADVLVDLPLSGDVAPGKPDVIDNGTVTVALADASGTRHVAAGKTLVRIDASEHKGAFDLNGRTSGFPCDKKTENALRAWIVVSLDRLAETRMQLDPIASCVPKPVR